MDIDKEELQGCSGSCGSCGGCGSDEVNELSDGMSPIITLTDEDGKDAKFEILDVVVMEDSREFLIVADAEKNTETEEDVEVTILEIKQENGEEVYDTVTDEELAQRVFDEFVSQQDDVDEEE